MWQGGLAGVVAVLALAAPASAEWTVGDPVTVSGSLTELAGCHLDGDDNTPQLAADPRDPGTVVLTYLAGDDNAQIAVRSSDGGRTWAPPAVLRGLTTCTGGGPGILGDPGAFVGPDGTAYAASSYIATAPGPTEVNHDDVRLQISVAPPGGGFASAPVDVDPLMPDQRAFFAADGSRVLVETERIPYAGAAAPGPTGGYGLGAPNHLVVLSTGDSGKTWTPSTPIPALPGHDLLGGGLAVSHGAIVAVASDADFTTIGPAIAAGTALPFNVVAYRSTDGGQTWSTSTTLGNQCTACNLPRATTASDGSVVASWTDQGSDGHTSIELARSTDGGATWSTSTVATAHRATDDQLQTAAAVAGDGTLGVLYYDGSQAAGLPLRAMLATSSDGGAHWAQTPLSPDMSYATVTNGHQDGSLGPYFDLLGQPDGFLAAYTVLAPFPLADGQQDVVAQRVTSG